MPASEMKGMLLMVGCGFGVSVELTVSSVLKGFNLPYFYLSGTAAYILFSLFVSICMAKGYLSALPSGSCKWVLLRGFFGVAMSVLGVLAVARGVPLGDVNALGCVNVVVAALLGRAFLGESLGGPHMAALCMSIAGAICITKPEALFGRQVDVDSVPVLGYIIALAAGVSSGVVFIVARRSQGVHPLIMSSAAMLIGGTTQWTLPSCGGVVDEVPLRSVVDSPLEAAGMLLAFLLLISFRVLCLSVGSQLCPAAVSSTILTASSMSFSYLAQVVVHGQALGLLSTAGAILMVSSVVLIAVARKMHSPAAAQAAADVANFDAIVSTRGVASTEGQAAMDANDDETESLASFVASELSGISKEQLRQRRTVGPMVGGGGRSAAEIIGHMGA